MLYTGVILLPTAIQADALADLADLKTVVNTAAHTIGAPTNASRNWGGWPLPGIGGSPQIGTAEVVQNITASILRANYNLGFNETKWTTVTTANGTRADINLTDTGLDAPYIDYINTIPNLSTALVALGRSWHREMNRPIHDAIQTLQNTITEFSSSLLQASLVDTNSTIRTIRASSALEDAQLAWGRPLNLPGSSQISKDKDASNGIPSSNGKSSRMRMMRRGWRGGVFPGEWVAGEDGEQRSEHGGDKGEKEMEPEPEAATVVEIRIEEVGKDKEKEMESRSAFNSRRVRFTHSELWGDKREKVGGEEKARTVLLVAGSEGAQEEEEDFERGENGMIFDGIHGPLVRGRVKVRPFLGD